LFGCRRYELSGPSLGERVHVADRPAYLTAFAEANAGGAPRTIEVRMRRDAMGESRRVPQFFWAEIAFSPIPDAQNRGARHEVVALMRDISERKDHEAELRAARKSAEEASEAKSRFLPPSGTNCVPRSMPSSASPT
jgi:cell cycle sensor histidine kinase DivJ